MGNPRTINHGSSCPWQSQCITWHSRSQFTRRRKMPQSIVKTGANKILDGFCDPRLPRIEPANAGVSLLEPIGLPAYIYSSGSPHLGLGLLQAPFAAQDVDALPV